MLKWRSEKVEYACAVGLAILALNEADAEILSLIEALSRRDRPELEAKYLSEKLKVLEKLAEKYADQTVRQHLCSLVSDAYRLNDDRHNFAHGLLWIDPFDGTHQRRFVPRRTGVPNDDPRTPRQIKEEASEIEQLGENAAGLAAKIRRTS